MKKNITVIFIFNPIGLPKKMRFDVVKVKLMRALGKMESSDDFMPLLRQMATIDAWVNEVIAAVEADPELCST
jgi:hypothetical protein